LVSELRIFLKSAGRRKAVGAPSNPPPRGETPITDSVCPQDSPSTSGGGFPSFARAEFSLRILLVDDEQAILETMGKLLTSWGCKVLPARCLGTDDANKILHDAAAFPFDVAIIGTVMPGIDGMQLSEQINRISPATVLILAIEESCIACSTQMMEKGLFVQPLPVPFDHQELKDALNGAISARHTNALVHLLRLPEEVSQLEAINLPTELARNLAGRSVSVDVLREEQPGTRKVEPDDIPLWIDEQGNHWNDYRPFRVLYTDDQNQVWRFRKIWLSGMKPPTENYTEDKNSSLKKAVFGEALSLPTEWDLSEINIPWEAANKANLRPVEVEVHTSPDHRPKVFWRDSSGSLWRIPNDWRNRRIRLPESEVLMHQGLPVSVARAYGEKAVNVNYHPGSTCCLPDRYRFRDERGRQWPVRIEDCVVLGFGNL
jgi:CheY-like chemotaxis protein